MASWEEAKDALLARLGTGTARDEAWVALKNLKKGTRDIVELAGEAEKLVKRLHPLDDEASERHSVDAFLGALGRPLAMEIQKLGHRTMEDVVAAAARRIEKIMEEQTDTKMEQLVSSIQEQIRILAKDFKNAHEQTAALKASPSPAKAMAATPAAAATSQAPPTMPARHIYQDYEDEAAFSRLPRCQLVRRPSRCFFCGEEGHFIANCPASLELQRLLRRQARADARAPPRGRILELPAAEDDPRRSPNVQLNC